MITAISDRPAARDRVIVLKSAEETAGEFFRCEYIAREVSVPPRDHIHTHQEERLEVVEGTVRCRVAGAEHVLDRGRVMVIPAGTPHAVWNEDPLGSRSISEYRPAMNAQAMFRGYIVNESREYNPSKAAEPERIARRHS
jgi:mannose-6-phosphate isomerase-like protein (cupin superfamily)